MVNDSNILFFATPMRTMKPGPEDRCSKECSAATVLDEMKLAEPLLQAVAALERKTKQLAAMQRTRLAQR